jgi:hypothetical protein
MDGCADRTAAGVEIAVSPALIMPRGDPGSRKSDERSIAKSTRSHCGNHERAATAADQTGSDSAACAFTSLG